MTVGGQAGLDRGDAGFQLTIDPPNELCHLLDAPLDTGLSEDVVVLDAIEQLGQTPERVGLDRVKRRRRQAREVKRFWVGICSRQKAVPSQRTSTKWDSETRGGGERGKRGPTDVGREEDLEEGDDEIVDPLDVA